MKIVILDGYAANPGDLSWDEMKQLGECTIYDRTSPAEVLERAQGAEVLLTNKTVLDAETINALPSLRYIGVLATGYNIVDTEAARARGVIVTNIPAYSTDSVAQMVFAHLLNICQQVQHHSEEVRRGRWAANPDFCFWDTPLIELAGKTMGIVGLGNTGMATAKIALAFGMKVIAKTSKSAAQLPEGITPASLDTLLAESDAISLNCPLTESTKGIINKQTIGKMKPSAILINTGRGPLVNENDLAEALDSGRIAAFCADVLSTEPPSPENPLLKARNCYLTPHIAWATLEARQRLMKIAADNIREFIEGKPLTNKIV